MQVVTKQIISELSSISLLLKGNQYITHVQIWIMYPREKHDICVI